MSTHAFHKGDNAMNDQLRHAFEAVQVRASQLSDAAQNFIALRILEEIEKQEHLADTEEKSYKIADEDEVMKRFYEIEPQYSKLFEKLAKL
jgi:hypothetical protein